MSAVADLIAAASAGIPSLAMLFTRASPPPTGGNSIGVGFGLDIPVFPPLFGLASLLIGLLLSAILGRKRFVPQPAAGMPVRVVLFGAAVASLVNIKGIVDGQFDAVGSGVDFTHVGGISTTGIFAISRNPLYVALCVLMPAAAVLFDNKHVLVMALALPLYLHCIVVPAEEAFLGRKFGGEYAAYMQATPRWVGF